MSTANYLHTKPNDAVTYYYFGATTLKDEQKRQQHEPGRGTEKNTHTQQNKLVSIKSEFSVITTI